MAKAGGWELDPETQQVSWTEETYRIHEVPLNQKPALIGSFAYCHKDDRPMLEEGLKRAVEHGESYDIELRLLPI